jgi:hypothetical protein
MGAMPWVPPDQRGFEGLEKSLGHRIIGAVSLPAHRYFEAMFAQDFLAPMAAILASAVGMVDAPFWRLVVRFRHLAPIFACPRPNVEISRTTSNDKFLVAFLNLTFVRRDCGIGDTNVKFTPLAQIDRHFQSADRQVFLHAIAYGPSNNAPGI